MKELLVLAGLAIGLSGAAASAGDASKAGYDWSGIFVGADIGYGGGGTGNGWRNGAMADWAKDGDMKYRSLLGGAHAGVQQQFGNIVLGAEADYTWMNFEGDDSRFAGVVNGVELRGVGTARARAGLALDTTLLYVTGGVAFGEITKTDRTLLNTQTKDKVVGWAAGAGAEHAFTENWVGRLGYRYTDLGESETLFQDPAVGSYSHKANDLDFHSIRVGLSYKF